MFMKVLVAALVEAGEQLVKRIDFQSIARDIAGGIAERLEVHPKFVKALNLGNSAIAQGHENFEKLGTKGVILAQLVPLVAEDLRQVDPKIDTAMEYAEVYIPQILDGIDGEKVIKALEGVIYQAAVQSADALSERIATNASLHGESTDEDDTVPDLSKMTQG